MTNNASITYTCNSFNVKSSYVSNANISYQTSLYATLPKLNYDFFKTTGTYTKSA